MVIHDPETGQWVPIIAGGDETPGEPAPVETPAETPEGDDTPEPEPKGAKMVPLAELIYERRGRQAMQGQLKEMQAKLDELTGKKEAKPVTPGSKEEWKAQWWEHLGLYEIRDAVAEVKALFKDFDPNAVNERLKKAELGADTVLDMRSTAFEEFAQRAFDGKTMPISKEGWEKLVAAEITAEDAAKIFYGDKKTMQTVVDRAKKSFNTQQLTVNRTKELQKVVALPRTPQPGGTPAAPPPEERLTGRKLHAKASEHLQEIFSREKA